MSPRAYQALLDRCDLWDLVCRRTTQAEIAQIMGKDPAWVSRTLKQIQADFSTVQATPNESGIIRENLVRWETIYADARRLAAVSEGFNRISALRVCAEVLRHKAEYEVTVGWVANRRSDANGARGPTWEEVSESVSQEDLETITLTMADSIRERRMQAANLKTLAAAPLAAKTNVVEGAIAEI
jgi:hypothetical protein